MVKRDKFGIRKIPFWSDFGVATITRRKQGKPKEVTGVDSIVSFENTPGIPDFFPKGMLRKIFKFPIRWGSRRRPN